MCLAAYALPQRLPSCSEGPTSIRGSEQRREGTGREGRYFLPKVKLSRINAAIGRLNLASLQGLKIECQLCCDK